jgi:7-cyano-7-deazaguanine reductase
MDSVIGDGKVPALFIIDRSDVMATQPNRDLETFPNPKPERDYTIRIRIPEFTCLCPKTGQPDFARLLLEYVPEQHCVELKSLKLYIWNQILEDLIAATQPRFMRLTAEFFVRGGMDTTVIAEHRAPGWAAPGAVALP